MSPHLAVIEASEPLLFQRITATLLLVSGPAQICNHLYIQIYIERNYANLQYINL